MSLRLTAALALLSGSAQAQLIVPVSQERWVEAHIDECGSPQTNLQQAATFDPFQTVVAVGVFPASGASARQNSVIDTAYIIARGEVSGRAANTLPPCCAEGRGTSYMRVEFDLSEDVRYSLEGYVTDPLHDDVGSVRLTDVDNGVVLHAWSAASGDEDFDVIGMLPAGHYELLQEVEAGKLVCDRDGEESEAGDTVLVFDVVPVPESYCVGAPNSAGAGAQLSHSGSLDLMEDDFTLEASGLPGGVSGLFYHGPNQIQVPFGDGFRCVGGLTRRVQPPGQADGSGILTRTLDLSPAFMPASMPRNFQLWYRDPMGPGGSGFNTSDALEVVFHN